MKGEIIIVVVSPPSVSSLCPLPCLVLPSFHVLVIWSLRVVVIWLSHVVVVCGCPFVFVLFGQSASLAMGVVLRLVWGWQRFCGHTTTNDDLGHHLSFGCHIAQW